MPAFVDKPGLSPRARVPGDLEIHAASQLLTKQDRVRFIIDMMSRDEWPQYPDTIPFRAKLAAAWEVSESSVKAYAADASNFLKMDSSELQQARVALANRCRNIADAASTSYNHVTGLCDFKSEMEALDRFAKYMGIEAASETKAEPVPVKVEIVYATDANRPVEVPGSDKGASKT